MEVEGLLKMSKGFHFFFGLLIAAGVLAYFFTNAARPQEHLKADHAQRPEDSGMGQALNAHPANETPDPQFAQLQKPGINKLCFFRDGAIYLQDIGANQARRIIEGFDPDIAPAGDKIAFTHYSNEPFGRHIKIFHLDTGRTDELNNITGSSNHSPHWSDDGNKIAFSVMVKKRWEIGLLDVATGEWRVVTDKLVNSAGVGFFFGSWSADNKSIICHDMVYIYEIALDGRLLRRIDIKTIIDGHDITSSTKFSFSPDQKFLLFNSASGPEENGIIFTFDLARRKLLPITPKTIDGSNPQWLPSGKEIIFSSREESGNNQATYNVRKISLEGSGLTTVIENARDASYALP